MDVKESYRILELEIGASRAEVDAAYVRLIEHWHPDQAASRGPDAVREAQRMVQAINDAYGTLAKIAPNTATPKPPALSKAEGSAPPPANVAPAKPRLPPMSAAPAAPAKPKLPPLVAGQPASTSTPPPRPPPPETWAARTAPLPGDLSRDAGRATAPGLPAASNRVPPTSPPPPAPPAPSKAEGPPVNFIPPPLAPTTPALAPAPPPVASAPETPAKTALFPDFRDKAVAIYDKLFPEDSPRRRYGPVAVAALLIFVLLLGKCTYSSLARRSDGPPDPKKTGRLVVKTNVATATIEAERIIRPGDRVDPIVTGIIDVPLSGLKPGKYAVTLRAEGWPDARGEVSMEAGRTTEAAINFKGGSLRLDSDPAGATVRLGPTVLGKTPLVIPLLPPGERQLSLEYPSWPLVPFKITITEGVEATGAVRLPHGKLTVTTTPPGAAVLLGKRTLGQTPLILAHFPAGTRKLTLQAKDFPPLEVAVTVEDRGDVKVSPALGSAFPVLDPAALLRGVWIPDGEDRIAPPNEGVTGPFQPRNGVVKNLNRKRLYESWLRKRYNYTAIVKSYDRASGQIEFADQKNEYSNYRVLAKLPAGIRNDPDLAAQLAKGATFAFYGRLSAVEEPRWPSKVITFEFSPADPLR